MLKKVLFNKDVLNFLNKYGYPVDSNNLMDYIDFLEKRIISNEEFPHEIGIFLGYPLEDVIGFIENKECKLSGYWKVYHDDLKAREVFEKYKKCCNKVRELLYEGYEFDEVFALV